MGCFDCVCTLACVLVLCSNDAGPLGCDGGCGRLVDCLAMTETLVLVLGNITSSSAFGLRERENVCEGGSEYVCACAHASA